MAQGNLTAPPGRLDGQPPVQFAAAPQPYAAVGTPPALQVRRVALPPMPVRGLRAVPPVRGVAPVAYPPLPLGTRERRYWFR